MGLSISAFRKLNTITISLFCKFLVDGQLSNKEFVAVMKNRVLRGLEKPKDTGFVKLIESVMKCVKTSYSMSFDN